MRKIETSRLRIIPLTLKQFDRLLYGIEELEKELKLTPSYESFDHRTQEVMEYLYGEALADPDNYIWYTNWQIILKSENKSIGSANFMNPPQENKFVEIGYGINSSFRNQGYMSEALNAICKWALKHSEIKEIIAKTKKDNDASQKVLQKCGFVRYLQIENTYWWKLE